MHSVPMISGAANAFARQERAPSTDRKRQLIGPVAEGDRIDRIVTHQLQTLLISQLITNAGKREILCRTAIGATFETHDREPCQGEFSCEDGARPAHADYYRIDFFELNGHRSLFQEKSAIDCGSAT